MCTCSQPAKMEAVKLSNFDDIFKYIGDFGRYQKRLYFMVILPAAICAMPTLATVFILAERSHRCKIPELPNDTFKVQGNWHSQIINRSIPLSDNKYSKCDLFKDRNVSRNLNETAEISCSAWVYDDSVFQNTVSSEYDLVCDKVVYQSTASSVYMAGLFLGSILFGAIGDAIGRKISLCLSITTMFAANLSLVFAPNYVAFVTIRFFAGMGNVGCFGQSFVLGLELVGKSKRVFAGSVIELFWCGGELLLAGIAYFLPDWRHIQIGISICIGILLSYWILVPESLRWLFSTGRNERANELLQKVATENKVTVPQSVDVDIGNTNLSFFRSLLEIMKSPTMILRTGILAICWAFTTDVASQIGNAYSSMAPSLTSEFQGFVINIGYYGLTLNTSRIGGNIYINYTVSVVMELVAYFACLLLVDRIGRRATHCGSMLLGGVSCLCSIFTVMYASEEFSWTTIVLSSIGKLGVSCAFAVIFILTPELYPTPLRSSAIGLNNFLGKIGGIISPYIADLGLLVDSDMKVALPLIVFGGTMILAGILGFALPETLGRKLPETIEEAAEMKKIVEIEKEKKREEFTDIQHKTKL